MPNKSVHSVPDLFVLSRDRDIEIEQSILAGMMRSSEGREVALRLLCEEDFYWTAHQVTFRAIKGMHQQGDSVDLWLIVDELRTQGSLDKAGGASGLTKIFDYTPVPGSMEDYCRRQARAASKQRLLIATNEIQRKAADPTAKIDDCYRRFKNQPKSSF
jgi:replicative DNA helicase